MTVLSTLLDLTLIRLRSAALLGPALLALSLATAPAMADDQGWPALKQLRAKGALVSATALDLDSGKIVAELDTDTRLTPASLSKLVIAAAALNHWDANRQFDTQVLASGPITQGRLDGDLILKGGGDPSIEGTALWTLAAQIKRAGVDEIGGRLRVVPAPFGLVECETTDRCESVSHSDRSYVALLSSVGVDYGNWCVDVQASGSGQPAEIRSCHGTRLPIPVEGSIRSVAGKSQPTFWVQRVRGEQGDSLRVSGEIPVGASQRLYRSMSDPSLGTGLTFKAILQDMGIKLTGTVEVDTGPLPPKAYELGVMQGLMLREQVARMLRFSNNYIADVLTLDLAASRNRVAPLGLAEAGDVLSRFVVEAKQDRSNPEPSSPTMHSGSGLTPENLISSGELVSLLRYQYRDTLNFPAFYGGLVVPRQAPFRFLRQGNASWLDRVALKTGTMNDPHSVCGLAGYLRKKDGGWIAFATIINGGDRRKHVPLYESMQAARADIEALLTQY